MESLAPDTSLCESDGRSNTNASQAKEEVKSLSDKSEYDEIKSETDRENVNMAKGVDDGDGGDNEFIDDILPDEIEPSEMDGVEEPRSVIPEVIEQHDIGLLKFDKDTGKAIVSDALRTEIIMRNSKYFQNSEGPFTPTNNRCINKSWFKRTLGNGRGEEVNRSWLVYSPSKNCAFCICCLLFSRSHHQSTLEQESGFNQWKAPERISVHENAKNHRESFTQWK